ncbi:hypothetical protein DPMN_034915 [Dreissena polymorpha]|uniref:Uncharacterized protein n=1 Tax=Dreissena polymorpha TaxID=45954 RepID=A0A9D4M9J5_DREPO|nr:hypothetical protein DPMN_034915 [Dreissena polymorpha]
MNDTSRQNVVDIDIVLIPYDLPNACNDLKSAKKVDSMSVSRYSEEKGVHPLTLSLISSNAAHIMGSSSSTSLTVFSATTGDVSSCS